MRGYKPTFVGKVDEWDAIAYPELTPAENEEIRDARRAGYASMFPAYPNAEAQCRNTLSGARSFMAGLRSTKPL